MTDAVIRQVEQFLYREARLLDKRQFQEWLTLFTDDARYWMPLRSTRYPRTSKAIKILDQNHYVDDEFTQQTELAYFDESKDTLTQRVARLYTGMAWAEDPPSRTRHMLTNIEVVFGETPNEITVHSNFMVYRSRAETEQDFYVGTREDTLRRFDGEWKIASRKIFLDQTVLLAKNLSIFL
jgi:biphenyl 2,3-dioxygenase beta subunit